MINALCKPNDRIIKIILYFIFASVFICYGIHLSVPLVIDEVGTLANTAFLAGDDWSLCVQSMDGFYYKYGVSVLYLPFYMLFKNTPHLMYKSMITLNMLIVSLVPVIAYHICRKHFKIASWKKAVLIASAGAGISSIWLYSLYLRSDAMLILLPWIVVLILLELSVCSHDKDKTYHIKSRLHINLLSFALAFSTTYAFMSHSRGIILLIATIITLLFMSITHKCHMVNYFVYLTSTFILLATDSVISSFFKNGVYRQFGTNHASLESFDFNAFERLFTMQGITGWFKLCIGWLFNVFTSTMGIIIIGIFAAIIIIFSVIKKNRYTKQETIFSIFSLLCFIGSFAMGTLFFFPYVYDLMTGVAVQRGDRLIYGRYMACTVTPLCLLAFYSLTNNNNIIKLKAKVLALLTYITVFFIFITKIGPILNAVPETNIRYFLSLTGYLNIENGETSAIFPDLSNALFKSGRASLAAFIIILIITCLKRTKLIYTSCIITIILSSINFNYVFTNVRYLRDTVVVENINYVTDYLNNISDIKEISNKYHTIFRCKNAYNIKLYQFELSGFDISNSNFIKNSNQDSFFIICKKNRIDTAVKECTAIYGEDSFYTIGDFNYAKANRDVIAIKGDSLANTLKDKGYHLKKYTIKK